MSGNAIAGPALPVGDRSTDRHGPRRAPDDPAAEPDVQADPGIERLAVGTRPERVAPRSGSAGSAPSPSGERSAMTALKAVRAGIGPHRADHEPGKTRAPPRRVDDDLERTEGIHGDARPRDRGPSARTGDPSRPGRPASVPSQSQRRAVVRGRDCAVGVEQDELVLERGPSSSRCQYLSASLSWSMNSGQTEPLKSPTGSIRSGRSARMTSVKPVGGRGRTAGIGLGVRDGAVAQAPGAGIQSIPMYGRSGAGTSTDPSGRW